jgi:hypothetical protein
MARGTRYGVWGVWYEVDQGFPQTPNHKPQTLY